MIVRISGWSVKVLDGNAIVKSPSGKTTKITLDKLAESGMMILPKKLYEEIRTNLRAANKYDQLMDMVFDQTKE
jgi:hypothetical protein